MALIGKYRWALTYIGLRLLKKALGHRLPSDVTLSEKDLPSEIKMVNRIDFILNFCKGRKVFHIGFADYPYTEIKIKDKSLLHLHIAKTATKLTGFDNNEQAVQEYISLTGDKGVIQGDIMQMQLTGEDKDFDIVLLGEVLEHLPDPLRAIENIYQNFSPGTIFLVTVPNHTSLDALAGSLHKKESIHPDHYFYFSSYTLLKLFPSEKFELQEFAFGMYYQKGKGINFVLRRFPFMGDCIIGVFKSKK